VDALGAWLMAERSLRGGDPRHAAAHAGRMVAAAEAASHRPLLRLAHELAGHLHEQAGQPAEALRQQRLVARLEREQRLHDLEGRDAVARSHLRLRAEERTSRALATQSQEFERMAFEDALTGIANSRRFQQCLAKWSAECEAAGETLCAAVIDVDRFKAVNDGFGHVVGDAVLRAIAAILVEHVRSVDLPARLGGDEFVILFRNADAAVARQVCDRIEHSVLNHPWGQLAAGVAVSISVGVAQALPGDTVEALIGRGDLAMFERKRSRHLPAVPALVVPAPPQRPVPPLLLDRLAALVRRARQMVVFHGPGPLGGASWSVAERERYGRAEGRIHHASAFAEFWRQRAAAAGAAQATIEHRLLARLAALKPTTTFVTQRVDGLLAAAGAGHVIELCGSLREDPAAVLLPGDPANARLAAGAELAVKRADVVLVVDADPLAFPGPSLLDKARFRGVAVVLLGSAFAPGGAFANIAIQAPAHDVLAALLERLGTDGDPRVPARGLTDAGYDALCFLSGHGTDHAGRTLAQTLAWTDREIERQFDSTQWQFPLPTASPVCPEAPVPTRGDFAALAADDGAKAGMRGAFHRMLRFYGFEWRDGRVAKADGWRARFDVWAVTPGHNDLRLSRMLGALALCGLQDESLALLRALEVHVPPVRQHGLAKALAFWRHAAGQGASASDEPRAPQASWRQ
jgi:diguanylate cyclase (GGDEF)-like protein